ncbi:MAG: hypothetical protein QOD62_260 [Actinomycetota bacterium]|nr:hypothetical protein [Actinomycetota bacterium]
MFAANEKSPNFHRAPFQAVSGDFGRKDGDPGTPSGTLRQMDAAEPRAPEAQPSAGPAEDAAAFFRQLGEQTSKVLTAAEEAGRGIREQARRDAAGIVAEARVQANELALAAASQRRAAEEELRRFREARTILANQIEDVHRRLEEIILRLRTPVEAPEPASPPKGFGAPPEADPVPVLIEVGEPAEPPLEVVPEPQVGEAEPAGDESLEEESAEVVLAVVVPLEPQLPLGEPAPEFGSEPAAAAPEPAFVARAEALADAPLLAGRTLKRLLQEDQNDLLDRIRRHRGRGTFEDDIFPTAVQVERFVEGMRPALEPAFIAGRTAGGGIPIGEPPDVVGALVAKQVVAPLRRDLGRMVEPRLAAGDTATTVSERAGDVYRVWKGVRTELLGEGLVYAAFHHGLLDAWREAHGPGKRWLLSPDEADCPRDTCRANAAAGVVGIDVSFPSGHLAPPAHGGCTCTVVAAGE